MPRIFDNIEAHFLPALQAALQAADHADICTGYFNLRGWDKLDAGISRWGGGQQCRLLLGMLDNAGRDLRRGGFDPGLLRRMVAERIGGQLLTQGQRTAQDSALLRRFRDELRSGRVAVRFAYPEEEHTKLYIVYAAQGIATSCFLGSSNLTHSGLTRQGETNTEILDQAACAGRVRWFDGKWQAALDIQAELVAYIEGQLTAGPASAAYLPGRPAYAPIATTYSLPQAVAANRRANEQMLNRAHQGSVRSCRTTLSRLLLLLVLLVVAWSVGSGLRSQPSANQQARAGSSPVAAFPTVTASSLGLNPTVAAPPKQVAAQATAVSTEAIVGKMRGQRLLVHVKPGRGASVVEWLNEGVRVRLLPEQAVQSEGRLWQHISTASGKTGWVAADYLVIRP